MAGSEGLGWAWAGQAGLGLLDGLLGGLLVSDELGPEAGWADRPGQRAGCWLGWA